MKFPTILLFGPPGSGKGTMGAILAEAGEHVHLSSGDVFRALSPDHKVHDYIRRGELVPDELTIEIVHEHLNHLIKIGAYTPETQLLFLDGIPRTLGQAKVLDRFHEVKQVMVLDVPDREVLVERIRERARVQGRGDDADPEILRTRMRVYDEQTKEVLTHYPKGIIAKINADQSRLEVLRDVLIALHK